MAGLQQITYMPTLQSINFSSLLSHRIHIQDLSESNLYSHSPLLKKKESNWMKIWKMLRQSHCNVFFSPFFVSDIQRVGVAMLYFQSYRFY